MKLKVGQKVRLVNKKPHGRIAGGWNDDMDKYLGKVVTIEGFAIYHDAFRIAEDRGIFIWDYKLIEEEAKATVLTTMTAMKKHFDFVRTVGILPRGAYIKKVIINGNCIITFVEFEGATMKAVTKCHECDTFDLQKGMDISMYKTAQRIAEKKLKKLCK